MTKVRPKTGAQTFIHSYIHFQSFFSLSWVAAGHAGLENLYSFQQHLTVLLAPHQGVACPSRDVITPPALWPVFRSHSHWCDWPYSPRQPFLGHSGLMIEPSQVRSLYSEKWIDIQSFPNFTAVHFLAMWYIIDLSRRQNSKTRPCSLISLLVQHPSPFGSTKGLHLSFAVTPSYFCPHSRTADKMTAVLNTSLLLYPVCILRAFRKGTMRCLAKVLSFRLASLIWPITS